MIIQLDFDGTVVEHEYPKIGRENFGSMEIIKKLQEAGHKIILNTYRADCQNGTLDKALNFLNYHHRVNLDLIAEYNDNKILPGAWNWEQMMQTQTIWIDDMAPQIPLKSSNFGNRKMVDWDRLDLEFKKYKIY
jgi:predicted mannosyl-3-phosphoglycerate phosphatase (HAD superfamily)